MQFQTGQVPYYHQFSVLPGLQMPPPTIIPPIPNIQGEEQMDIPGTSTGTQRPQRPPLTGNPDYISPLKRETGIEKPAMRRMLVPDTTSHCMQCKSQSMDQEKPEVTIADPPNVTTSAVRGEDIAQGKKLMEIVKLEGKEPSEMEQLVDQMKEMKQKIEMLKRERYGREAMELAKKIEANNEEEEETRGEPHVKVVSEIEGEEEEMPQLSTLPPPCRDIGSGKRPKISKDRVQSQTGLQQDCDRKGTRALGEKTSNGYQHKQSESRDKDRKEDRKPIIVKSIGEKNQCPKKRKGRVTVMNQNAANVKNTKARKREERKESSRERQQEEEKREKDTRRGHRSRVGHQAAPSAIGPGCSNKYFLSVLLARHSFQCEKELQDVLDESCFLIKI
uniref:Uncharacterized protein n=1 Tax=Romanomermis culicivorax TaxID=13658 RepID=A0A915J0Z6_ROMCU